MKIYVTLIVLIFLALFLFHSTNSFALNSHENLIVSKNQNIQNYYNLNFSKEYLPSNEQQNVSIIKSFEGIHYGNNGPYVNNWVPPDTQIAVSDKYIVELVNVIGAVWYKNGTFLNYISLYSLFNVPATEDIGDPRIIYDNSSGRFFASVYDINAVLVAVSTSNNPNGQWFNYKFYTTNNYFPDQPYIGVNDNFLVVTANDFNGQNFVYSQYWIANKSQMIKGEAVNIYSSTDSSAASIRPVLHLTSSKTFYMVSTQTIAPNLMKLYEISGTLPNSIIVNASYLNINPLPNNLQPAPQLGSSNTIDTGDSRVQDAFYQDGKIWLTANDQCLPPGDVALRTCIRVIQINVTSSSISQDYDVSIKNNFLFYGAIRLISGNIPLVVFGYSSQSNYPGIMIYYKIGNQQFLKVIKNGTGPETTICNNGVCRYGDYFSAAIDPSTPNSIWVAGEYGRGSIGWGTYIAQISLGFYIEVSFSVIGGGKGYLNPTLTYYFQSVKRTVTITEQPAIYQADPDSPWMVDNILPGSNKTEMWETNQTTSGIVKQSLVLNFVYYHQYNVNFTYTIIGGGNYIAPDFSFYQFGKNITVSVSNWKFVNTWVDAGSKYSFLNPLKGSNQTERWISLNATGYINSPETVNVIYYHQYLFSISISFVGSQTKNAIPFSYVQFGTSTTAYIINNITRWLDANSHWNIPNPLPGSNEKERWFSLQNTTGEVVQSMKINLVYYHQYYITIKIDPNQAGTINVKSGWYNENQEIQIIVQTEPGWKFINWIGEGVGSYTGSDANITLVIRDAITEEGIFYAQVTISASNGLTLVYNVLNNTGTINEGSSITLYLPVNSTLEVKANLNSFLYGFSSWSGTIYSTDSNLSIKISGPTKILANSSLNYTLIGVIVLLVAIAIVATMLVISRRKLRK